MRAELHRLLETLSRKSYDEALDCILPQDDGGQPWTIERLSTQLQPFFTEHGAIDVRPRARAPSFMQMTGGGDQYQAVQRIVAPDQESDEADWAIFVDLDLSDAGRAGLPEDAPVLRLRGLGV